jgi:hypothetical protein
LFEPEAACVLSGKPLIEYLPPVAGEGVKRLTPTRPGKKLGATPNKVGRILKANGLHGEPFRNVAPHSEIQSNLKSRLPYTLPKICAEIFEFQLIYFNTKQS